MGEPVAEVCPRASEFAKASSQQADAAPQGQLASKETAALQGLWASSLGQVVSVTHLGCKFDELANYLPITSQTGVYKVGDLESLAVTDAKVDWRHHATQSEASWYRLSRQAKGEWKSGCDGGREGEVVRLEDNFNFVMEINAEPIKLKAGV